jgi:AcrR family transcriptional regulator
LLRAANRVVEAQGVAGLTLDAVAREAGMSKGGLLYHFPSKDALIGGMIEHLLDAFDAALAAELAADAGPASGRWLRAFVRATFAEEAPLLKDSAGLFAAVANNPALLEPIRRHAIDWQRRAENDGLDPALGTVVRLATDGLWFVQLMRFGPPSPTLRAQVQATLERLLNQQSS